ncbi:MAG: DUF2518 family protein [Oscillatoriales cyanobacterium RM1_1_9]|nr:DUF2518 family protein [Oscillatoriales cyanobacterium SM2_3_0]NJO46876.1 DUF2518 family protein [Oscillatoriales cyanobacterium RM2_1_1]NJO70749.1 DUF2518 family protein [Oscillatoriales cyanobacterium RM1_1_9]
MLTTPELLNYAKWVSIATLVFAAITVLGFILNWGIRFRLVGLTAFTGVLAGGILGLGLGLFTRTEIPGAVHYSRVFDDGAREIVIVVAPDITETQLEATLQQAAGDLLSPGRIGRPDQQLHIRARTILHPQSGVSQPLYLGEIKQSLAQQKGSNLEINLFSEAIAELEQIRS